MAIEGLKPWVYTITPFLIERPFEQVKLDIDQQNVNVKTCGFCRLPPFRTHPFRIKCKKLTKLFKNINKLFSRNSEETEKFVLKSYKNKGLNIISLKTDKNLKKILNIILFSIK